MISPSGLSFEKISLISTKRVDGWILWTTQKNESELIGMKRNYQHLLSSKKWMLALTLTKCINRDVRRGWKKIYSIYWAVCCWWKEDFVVRKIKKKEEILECVDGWTKLTFFKWERERILWMYKNSCGSKCTQTIFPRFYFDIKITRMWIKNKSHPFEDDRLKRGITAVGLFTRIIPTTSWAKCNPYILLKFHQTFHISDLFIFMHAQSKKKAQADEINFIYYYYFSFLSLSL